MPKAFKKVGLLCIGLTTLTGLAWTLTASALYADGQRSQVGPTPLAEPRVEISYPTPPGGADESEAKAKLGPDGKPEACTSGCSLGKHQLPPYGRGDFARARYGYADKDPEAPGEALETLLFHGEATRHFLAEMGPGRLSPTHVAFLERELARAALVEIRMVDNSGRVRVTYGPQRVPFGIKQHLHPVDHDLQPLEFNGTVMRTGVNYLWSRY